MSDRKNDSMFHFYANYEQSVALKELGLDERCLMEWEFTPIPLRCQVFEWFREKKLCDSYVYRYQSSTDGSVEYGYCILHDFGVEETKYMKQNFTSYEEAESASIDKLIELIKNK